MKEVYKEFTKVFSGVKEFDEEIWFKKSWNTFSRTLILNQEGKNQLPIFKENIKKEVFKHLDEFPFTLGKFIYLRVTKRKNHFMKKLLIYVILILFSSCIQTKTINESEEKEYIEEKQEVLYYKGTPFSGVLVDFYKNGQLEFKINYYNGKRQGLSEGYYENGYLFAKENFKNGELDGNFEYYDENGDIEDKGVFKLGILESRELLKKNINKYLSTYLFTENCIHSNDKTTISFNLDGTCKIVSINNRTEQIDFSFNGRYQTGFSKYEDTGGDFRYIRIDWDYGYTSKGPMCYSIFPDRIVRIKDFKGFDKYGPIVSSWRSEGGLVNDCYVYR